jgi:hypothetical protein
LAGRSVDRFIPKDLEVAVKPICLVGSAVVVCLLASVAGTAIAASSKSSTKTSKAFCSVKTSIVPPAADPAVLPPASQGTEYGSAHCSGGLGHGVQADSFTVPSSGDTLARYTMYFGTGSVHGTYHLTPQSSSLNFLATNWTGTMKVTGGTGAWKGVKGTGTMKCSTADGVHTTCKDHLKLKMAG